MHAGTRIPQPTQFSVHFINSLPNFSSVSQSAGETDWRLQSVCWCRCPLTAHLTKLSRPSLPSSTASGRLSQTAHSTHLARSTPSPRAAPRRALATIPSAAATKQPGADLQSSHSRRGSGSTVFAYGRPAEPFPGIDLTCCARCRSLVRSSRS